jgi:hypothetical protein
LALVQLVLSTHQQMALTQLSQQLLQPVVVLVPVRMFRLLIQAVQVLAVQVLSMQVRLLAVLEQLIKAMPVVMEHRVPVLTVQPVVAVVLVQ